MYSRLLHSCSYLNFLFRPVLEILSQGYVKQKAQSSYLPARISLGHFDVPLGSAPGTLLYPGHFDQSRACCCTLGISSGHFVVLLGSAPYTFLYFFDQLRALWSISGKSLGYFCSPGTSLGYFVALLESVL